MSALRGQQVCCTITVFCNITCKKHHPAIWVLPKFSRGSPVKWYGPVMGYMWGTGLRARSSNQYFNTFTVEVIPTSIALMLFTVEIDMILKKTMFSFLFCEMYWYNRRQDTANRKCITMLIRRSRLEPLVLCLKFNINFLVPKSRWVIWYLHNIKLKEHCCSTCIIQLSQNLHFKTRYLSTLLT